MTLFSTRLGSPESRQHGPPADLLSISPSGELAISMNRQFESRWVGAGRLALLSLDGSEPRDLKRGTQDAEWANGTELVVIRRTATGAVLEYPSGSAVYQVRGFIMQPRVAPTNGDVAFLQRQSGDESVELVDRSGEHRTLVSGLSGVTGLAWSATGTEVCYTATRSGSTAVYGVTRSGVQRRIMELAGEWTLNDVARNGRVLMTQHYVRGHTIVGTSGVERDFSWLDRSAAAALSDDGQLAILAEIGAGGGPGRSVYARRLDGSAAVRLGDGEPRALSPDGQWVVAIQEAAPERLVMLPTGGGDPKPLPNGRITDYYEVKWLADNRHIVLSGIEPGVDLRRYKQDVHGGAPQATGALPSVYSTVFLPDGRYVGRVEGNVYRIFSADGLTSRPIPDLVRDDYVVQAAPDNRTVFVATRDGINKRLARLDLETGQRVHLKDIVIPDSAGVKHIAPQYPLLLVTPDGETYMYSYLRILSDLYLIERFD